MMNCATFVVKSPEADLLRETIGFAAERLMELEVGALTGAAYGEKDPARRAQRNGYHDRDWETRAETVELRINQALGDLRYSRLVSHEVLTVVQISKCRGPST